MDKFRRPVPRFLSFGLGAFRRAAVAPSLPPHPAAARCYSTRANDKYAAVTHFITVVGKAVILYGGTAVAVHYCLKNFLTDYGGYRSEAEKCRVLKEEINKECKLIEDVGKRMEERDKLIEDLWKRMEEREGNGSTEGS